MANDAARRADLAKRLAGFAPGADFARIARFATSGVATTLFYFAVTNLLVMTELAEPVAASVYAYLSAIVVSYRLQSRFTFRLMKDSWTSVSGFLVVSLGGLAISYVTMKLFSEWLGLSYVIGALVVCVLIPVANYVLFSRIVFRVRATAEKTAQTDASLRE